MDAVYTFSIYNFFEAKQKIIFFFTIHPQNGNISGGIGLVVHLTGWFQIQEMEQKGHLWICGTP